MVEHTNTWIISRNFTLVKPSACWSSDPWKNSKTLSLYLNHLSELNWSMHLFITVVFGCCVDLRPSAGCKFFQCRHEWMNTYEKLIPGQRDQIMHVVLQQPGRDMTRVRVGRRPYKNCNNTSLHWLDAQFYCLIKLLSWHYN